MNPNRQQPPFAGMKPKPTPAKIVIEIVDPVNVTSKLTVQGNLTKMGVAMILASQLNVLLPNMFAEMIKGASGVTDAAGNPVLKEVPDTFDIQTEEQPETAVIE